MVNLKSNPYKLYADRYSLGRRSIANYNVLKNKKKTLRKENINKIH